MRVRFLQWVPIFLSIFFMYPSVAKNLIANPSYTSFTVHEVKHDTSMPLRDMTPVVIPEEIKVRPRLRAAGMINKKWRAEQVDFALQTAIGSSLDIIQGVQFQGLGESFPGFTVVTTPGDPNGSVGMTQFVQWVNLSFAVFDKHTGAVIQPPMPGNTIWAGFGGECENRNSGDPIAHYDRFAHRWFLTQFAFHFPLQAPFFQCIAVSTSEDATGTYNRYAYQFGDFNDYGKLGIWPDPTFNSYFMTFNMSEFGHGDAHPRLGPRICGFDRIAMLNGRSADMHCFQIQNPHLTTLLPADLDGPTLPPPKTPGFAMGFNRSGHIEFYRVKVSWTDSRLNKLEGPYRISGVAPFIESCNGSLCIPQKGATTHNVLDSLGDTFMYRLAYRQFPTYGAILVNHAIQTRNTLASVRWYEIHILNSGSYIPSLFQQGTFNPDSNNRFMGSMAMDKKGNIALGYSVSSSAVYPSIRLTGRLHADPKGIMRTEREVIAGENFQRPFYLGRWGDYSSMAIDPSDDCTFWYTNEYIAGTPLQAWSTYVTSFRFPDCRQ